MNIIKPSIPVMLYFGSQQTVVLALKAATNEQVFKKEYQQYHCQTCPDMSLHVH